MLFRVSIVEYRHSGNTDQYCREIGTIEASSAAEAPDAFARSKGFERAIRWSETHFDIGNQRYVLAPA